MRFLKPGEQPTLEMIRADLKANPPGTTAFGLHVEYAYNSPHYIAYLLRRLEDAEQPFWKKCIRSLRAVLGLPGTSRRVTATETAA